MSETEAPCPSLPEGPIAREQPIRFAAVDLVVRVAGALALHGVAWDAFQEWWKRTEKRGEELRQLITADGPTRTTRDKLAEVAGVHRKTVDAWLDEGRRPERDNIRAVAAHLAPLAGESEPRMRRRLEWHWIACDLCDAVTRWTDVRQSQEIAGAFGEYVTRTLGLLQLRLPNPQATSALSRVYLATGTWPFLDQSSPRRLIHAPADLFATLLTVERHPLWRATLAHAGRNIPHGMHEWARCMVSYDEGLAKLGPREGRPGLGPDEVRSLLLLGFAKTALRGVPMPWNVPALSKHLGPKSAAFDPLDRIDGLLRADDHQSAEANARRALEIMPDEALGHFYLGSALWLQGRIDDGVAALREAARLEPKSVDYRREIGMALNAGGRSKEAIEEIETAMRDLGRDPWLVATLAWFRCAAGEVEGVGDLWEEAVRGLPDDGTLLSDAALFFLKHGDRRAGRRHAKAAAKLGYPEVLRALESGALDGGGDGVPRYGFEQ